MAETLIKEQTLKRGDLTTEEWREYEFMDDFGTLRNYRITEPVEVRWRNSGTTHRVLDVNGIVHCVPGPGIRNCVLRWKTKPGTNPISW